MARKKRKKEKVKKYKSRNLRSCSGAGATLIAFSRKNDILLFVNRKS